MPNLSSFSKNKKILFFVFLGIFICSGLFFVSHIVSAQEELICDPATGMMKPNPAVFGDPKECTAEWESTLGFSWKGIVAGLVDIVVWMPKIAARLVTALADVALYIKNWPITNTQSGNAGALAFASGWISVRGLANMLIVLGFVIIGIATTLRINEYAAKKMLPKLILVALLINFSGVFCGLIIDASNLTMSGLLQQDTSGISGGSAPAGGGVGCTASPPVPGAAIKVSLGGMGTRFMKTMEAIEKDQTCSFIKGGLLKKYIATTLTFAFLYLAIAFCFLYLAVMMLARYVVLGILYILSPIAFAFYAFPFPKAKDLWDKWWSTFIKWAFVGVGICFFLNIAGQMLKNFPALNAPTATTTANDILLYLFVVLGVIVAGILVTSKAAPIAAGAVLGMVTGGAALAFSGAKGIGKIGNRLSGGRVGDFGQKVSGKFGRAMENVGLRDKGSTAMGAQSQLGEASKRIGAMDDDSKAKLAMGKGMGAIGVTERDRAAAVMSLAKGGSLSKLGGSDEQRAAVTRAQKYLDARGISSTDAEGKSSLMTTATRQNPGISGDPAKIREAVQSRTEKELTREVDSKSVGPALMGAMSDDQMQYWQNNAPANKRNAMRDLVSTTEGQQKIQEHLGKITNDEEATNFAKHYSSAIRTFNPHPSSTVSGASQERQTIIVPPGSTIERKEPKFTKKY